MNAPTVPANVGVAGVLGLQNLFQLKRPPGIASGQGQGQCLDSVCTGVSYGCPATFTDPAGDATSLPQSAPQLDILHGDVALSADGTKIRAALTVSNLSTTVPLGWTSEDWIMYWTQPADGVAPPPGYTRD